MISDRGVSVRTRAGLAPWRRNLLELRSCLCEQVMHDDVLKTSSELPATIVCMGHR